MAFYGQNDAPIIYPITYDVYNQYYTTPIVQYPQLVQPVQQQYQPQYPQQQYPQQQPPPPPEYAQAQYPQQQQISIDISKPVELSSRRKKSRFFDFKNIHMQTLIKIITNFVFLVIKIAQIVIPCLLSVFIPQWCPIEGSYTTPHECTSEENFEYLTSYNLGVVIYNFLFLGFMLFHFCLVWDRDKYICKHFATNENVTPVFMTNEITHYPELGDKINTKNKVVYITSCLGFLLALINTIISGILVFHYYFDGEVHTVAVFFMYAIIPFCTLYDSYHCSGVGLDKKEVLSILETENVSFNVVHADYIKERK